MTEADGPNVTRAVLPRLLKAFLMHLLIFVLAALAVYFLTNGDSNLSDATRAQFYDSPEQLRQIREDAVWQLLMWLLTAVAVSWIIAALWLFSAERCRPDVPAQGSMRLGAWILCLFLSLAAAAVIGWRLVWSRNIDVDLATGSLFLGTLLVLIAVFLAYYLSTALFVKPVMKRSVPLSGLFLR